MIGYIFDKESKIIATKITKIKACNSTTIKGDGMAVIGTGEYIILDLDLEVGDILPDGLTDKRNEIPVLNEQ